MGTDISEIAVRRRYIAWCREECAVTSIEYALIASLIAVVIIGAVATTGENLSNAYSYVATCVQNLQCS